MKNENRRKFVQEIADKYTSGTKVSVGWTGDGDEYWRCSRWGGSGTLDFFQATRKARNSWTRVPIEDVPPTVLAAGRQRMRSYDQVRRARGFALMGAFARWYMYQPCRPDRDNVEFRLITSDWALAA